MNKPVLVVNETLVETVQRLSLDFKIKISNTIFKNSIIYPAAKIAFLLLFDFNADTLEARINEFASTHARCCVLVLVPPNVINHDLEFTLKSKFLLNFNIEIFLFKAVSEMCTFIAALTRTDLDATCNITIDQIIQNALENFSVSTTQHVE